MSRKSRSKRKIPSRIKKSCGTWDVRLIKVEKGDVTFYFSNTSSSNEPFGRTEFVKDSSIRKAFCFAEQLAVGRYT